jgi:hypothetical protein
MDSDFLKSIIAEIGKEWPTVIAAPFPFVGAIAVGLMAGWVAAGVLLKQRLQHFKDLVEQYEKALDNPSIARPRKKLASNTGVGAFIIFGVIILFVSVVLLYIALSVFIPAPTSNFTVGFKNVFKDPHNDPGQFQFNIMINNIGNAEAKKVVVALSGSINESSPSEDENKKNIGLLREKAYGQFIKNETFPSIASASGRVITIPNLRASSEDIQAILQSQKLFTEYVIIEWEDASLHNISYNHLEFCGTFSSADTSYYHNCIGIGDQSTVRLLSPRQVYSGAVAQQLSGEKK